jgi:hypothetical protein
LGVKGSSDRTVGFEPTELVAGAEAAETTDKTPKQTLLTAKTIAQTAFLIGFLLRYE